MKPTLAGFIPGSLVLRLTLIYALAFMVFLSVTFVALFISIKSLNDQQMDEELHEDASEYVIVFEQGGESALIEEVERDASINNSQDDFMQLHDVEGSLIFSSSLTHWSGLKARSTLLRAIARGEKSDVLETIQLSSQEAPVRVLYTRLSDERLLFLGESLEEREEMLETLPLPFASVFLVAVLVASALVWALTHRSIRGITAVSNAAAAIAGGDLKQRVGARHEAVEVQVLADTFDAMAARTQSLITEMRDMTDNIAHDLRSPLARMRVVCESALSSTRACEHPENKLGDENRCELEQAARSTIDECDRLIRMINVSLDVSEAEAGVSRHPHQLVDLTDMTEAACELFETLAASREIEFTYATQAQCLLEGVPETLQRMLANVIDNAIKFTLKGGRIRVELSADDEHLWITTTDSGIGMPEDQRQRIFDRFYRTDISRSIAGCGLGLSYSRAVARLHGGDIRVNSVDDGGSCFVIELPRKRATQRHFIV